MEPHVKKVLDLWRESVSQTPSKIEPYRISEQLKNFAALFAPGNFYYYVLNFPELRLEYVHEGTREVLGIPPEEVTMEKLIGALIPEERESMARKEAVVVDFFLNFLEEKEPLEYKSVYFFRARDLQGRIHQMLHQATVLTVTEKGEPEYVMVVHTDVSHLSFLHKQELSFVNLRGGRSYLQVDSSSGGFTPESSKRKKSILNAELSFREKEVIRLLGQGMGAEQISTQLSISVHTVRTHRKNILKKTKCRNTAELVTNCLIEGLI